MSRSSTVESFNYDPSRMDLGVQFKNGKEYVYTPVSLSLASQFANAKSKGKFFNNYIKDNVAFTCMKVVDSK